MSAPDGLDTVLGIGEHIPRYGLWITSDPRSQAAVAGLVAEGYDFRLTYKWGCQPRERVWASQYVKDVLPGGRIHEAERRFDAKLAGGDYLREVFVSYPVELVQYVHRLRGEVAVAVASGDVVETVDGVKVVPGAGQAE